MTSTNEMAPREAAQTLGIRLDSVYALIWAGKLKARKSQGKWQIPTAGVEDRRRARQSNQEGRSK